MTLCHKVKTEHWLVYKIIPLTALVLSRKIMRRSSSRHRSGLHPFVSRFFIANSCMEWAVFHWSSKYITVLIKLAGKNLTNSLSLSLIIPQISTHLDDSERVNSIITMADIIAKPKIKSHTRTLTQRQVPVLALWDRAMHYSGFCHKAFSTGHIK